MSTRREFLKNTAAAGVAGAAAISAAQSAENKVVDPKPRVKQPAAQISDSYARQLEAALAATGVTGASFAYWDGSTLHTATAGLRNSVTGDPVTPDTVMYIGSITKVLNAALMMQLVDERKIALEDPVIKHLPELRLRDRDALKRITCAMLINHTNGIDCDWLPEYGPDEERILDSVNRCADLDQLHAPGETASYSNMGTVIAGYLTQKLRGESWYTLVKRRFYEPLGMHHALVDPLEVPRFRCSVGDVTDNKTGKLVQTLRPFLAPSFAPAGSTQMSTAADLVTFARALLDGGVGTTGKRILSAAAAKRMTQPTAAFVPMSSPTQIGLGWMIVPGGVLTHGGGGRGVVSKLYAHPGSGRTVALLTNCDRGGKLQAAMLGPIVEAWTGIKASASQPYSGSIDLDTYVGEYENNMMRYEIFARDGGLGMRQGAQSKKMGALFDLDQSLTATLRPLGNHLFEAEYSTPGMSKGELRFVPSRSGDGMRFLASGVRLYRRANQ